MDLKIINMVNTTNINQMLKKVALALVTSLLIAASAQVSINVGLVPITLQTFAVAFIALTLSKEIALMAVLMYIGEIFMGYPVMANFQSLTALNMMNMGFVLGFIPMTLYLIKIKDTGKNIILHSMISNVIVYVCGMIVLSIFIGFSFDLLKVAVLPFIIPDIIKTSVALGLSQKLK